MIGINHICENKFLPFLRMTGRQSLTLSLTSRTSQIGELLMIYQRIPASMSLRSCIIPCLFFVVVGITSCSKNKTTYNPEMGPFDEDGNYIEAWADNPPKPGLVSNRREPTPDPRTASIPKPIYKPTSAPIAKVTPKPKPRPVVVKPKRIRYVVKKGDTLWGLARKFGTTVSKIQKANGLRGTVIRQGKTYSIPK